MACRRTRSGPTIPRMLESNSPDPLSLEPVAMGRPRRVVRSRPRDPSRPPNLPEIQPLPRWARLNGGAGGDRNAMFLAGAGIAHLDQILRAGVDVSSAGLGTDADISSASSDSVDVSSAGKNFGVEPVFSGALRQRLALKAAATCARLARLREDEAALRDAEHLSGCRRRDQPGRPPASAISAVCVAFRQI